MVPMIATEVPSKANGLVSEDGLIYTFPIRGGVKFHDGTDLTAEDIEYSWNRVLTMDLPESQAETLSSIVVDFRAVDDYTFEAFAPDYARAKLMVLYRFVTGIGLIDLAETPRGVSLLEIMIRRIFARIPRDGHDALLD